jgi:hypothetical protein
LFPALEFLVHLLQHLPDARTHLARLLAKVCEVDALRCSRCGSPMKVLAVITDPPEVRRIPLHLIKTGGAPPGVEASSPN